MRVETNIPLTFREYGGRPHSRGINSRLQQVQNGDAEYTPAPVKVLLQGFKPVTAEGAELLRRYKAEQKRGAR